jgi:hypothetical protein
MIKPGQTWNFVLMPKRSIKIVGFFNNSKYSEFRPTGWIVQGYDNEVAYGSHYEIMESSINENFVIKS